MAAPAITIDFGTTRTKVAYYDQGRNSVRRIELGREIRGIIPSVFYVPPEGQGERLVGDDAQDMVELDAEGIVLGLKKDIHRLGKLRCGPGRPSVGRKELAGEMFTYLRRRCRDEVFHAEVTQCILTVPVAFEEQKRECIRDAATMGGFKHIVLIEEPVAAARAWLASTGQKIHDHVIVCDVGGGTTDLALLRYDHGQFEPVAEVPPAGFGLGGNDVDEAILAHLLDDQHRDDAAVGKYRSAFLVKIRRAKELHRPTMPVSYGGTVLTVTSDDIGRFSEEFIDRVVAELNRFLGRCETVAQVKDIPVLLVGGGSRSPGLKEKLERLAPNRVYQWNHSDYAPVLGAAIPVGYTVKPSTHQTTGPTTALGTQTRRAMKPSAENSSGTAAPHAPDTAAAARHEPSSEARGLLDHAKHLQEQGRQFRNRGSEENRTQAAQYFQTALQHVQAACDLEQGWPDAFYWKGQVLTELNEWMLAVAAYTVCLRLDPDHADTSGSRGFCKLMAGDPVGARQDLDGAIRNHAKPRFHWARAVASFRLADAPAAVADLCAALATKDPETPSAALHAIAGFVTMGPLTNPREAIPFFARALREIPRQVHVDYANAFTIQCGFFGITTWNLLVPVPGSHSLHLIHPTATVQNALWFAAQSAYGGCNRTAVKAFVAHNGDHDIEFDDIWQRTPQFAYYLARIWTKRGQGNRAIHWLCKLLAAQPDFDFARITCDLAMKDFPDDVLSFLTPKWSYTEDHGVMFNHLTITNRSPFRLNAVVVYVQVTKSDGTGDGPIEKRLDHLDSGASHRWENFFQEGGWFGSNFREVRVRISCAEGDAVIDSSAGSIQRSALSVIAESFPCPNCGSIAPRGGTCRKCGFEEPMP